MMLFCAYDLHMKFYFWFGLHIEQTVKRMITWLQGLFAFHTAREKRFVAADWPVLLTSRMAHSLFVL